MVIAVPFVVASTLTLVQAAPSQTQAPSPSATEAAAAAPDDPVQTLVGRLDLERYKATLKGLTQFGDRRQGTDRNRAAVDWIEAQLKSYGCPTERLEYEYVTPQRGNTAGGRGGRGAGGGRGANQGNKRPGQLLQELAEVVALEELHHHVRHTVLERADVGDARDVLALELHRGLRFAKEPIHGVLIEQDVLAQHLDRDAFVQRQVRALGDHAHSAVAEDRIYAILALKDLANADASVGWFNSLSHARKS
jgi:hypothetical protein